MPKHCWMVRAEGGTLVDAFEEKGVVALGWRQVPDLTLATSREAVRELYSKAYPQHGSRKQIQAVAMLFGFRVQVKEGDRAVTYDPEHRRYLIGEIASDYVFDPKTIQGYPHIRKVNWIGKVSRDDLSVESKKALGPPPTYFSIDSDVAGDLEDALAGHPLGTKDAVAEAEELSQVKEDYEANSIELIKDRILLLDEQEMEKLVAAVLRAMGYRARVTPQGPDRGVDVTASKDGLGLEAPRIKAEVKHRPNTPIGSQDVRSFIGGLREGDRGLYVSTGGFTKDAKYEADRSLIPLTLVTLDDLVLLIKDHYERFDVDGRVLLPLVPIYMPG